MGRAPCCDKANVKKGPWSPEEDAKLKEFIHKYGTAGNWISLPQKAGLKRCGKSCRLRWLNYLRPNIKHGEFSDDEDRIICSLYASIGSRWSIIASQLPGRTDNDIKNYWNTKLKKKILGFLPSNQAKFPPPFSFLLQTSTPQSSQSLSNLSHLCTSIDLTPKTPLYSNSHLHHDGYYPMKDNMLVFGASEAATSCPSSEGSCSQISVKQEEGGFFTGFVENRSSFAVEESVGSVFEDLRNGVVGNSQLQYDLDEVKQLITAAAGGGVVNNSLWLGDGRDCGEMGMYYF